MVCQMTAFIVAVSHKPLTGVHPVVVVEPLLVMAFAAIVLGETIRPRRCAAVGFGFLGVLVSIRPGTGVFNPVSLVALAGAGCWGRLSYPAARGWRLGQRPDDDACTAASVFHRSRAVRVASV